MLFTNDRLQRNLIGFINAPLYQKVMSDWPPLQHVHVHAFI